MSRHHRLTLKDGWAHNPATELTAFAAEGGDRPAECQGRASITFGLGGFDLRLALLPAQLQALAAVLQAVAAEQSQLNDKVAA